MEFSTIHEVIQNIFCPMQGILSRMTTAQASVGDWQALYKVLQNMSTSIHLGCPVLIFPYLFLFFEQIPISSYFF